MRELTLTETSYLAAGLLLCLLLPLLLSFCGPKEPAARKACLKVVWTGQLVLAVAGLGILFSSQLTPYAAAFGFLGYTVCTIALLRQGVHIQKPSL